MLNKLPAEILCLIIDQLKILDLRSLSQTSKYFHAVAAQWLWQSVAITPRSEYLLHHIDTEGCPEEYLIFISHLHFRSRFNPSNTWSGRCGHVLDPTLNSDDENAAGDKAQPPFGRLAGKVKQLLGKIAHGQLRSFSWDLGTCVPAEILGTNGLLPLNQPLLRSLSLTTSLSCRQSGAKDLEIDLSSFRQLESLRWRAPAPDYLNALTAFIQNNSSQLQELELDFVNWQKLWESIDLFITDGDDVEGQLYFMEEILGLKTSPDIRNPCPLFPQLRVLSLSNVPVSDIMLDAINLTTIESLTLRRCVGWDFFLESIVERISESKTSIALKVFEMTHSGELTDGPDIFIIQDFLRSFDGLESLFLGLSGWIGSLDVWKSVTGHHETLKRLVYHHRSTAFDTLHPEVSTACDSEVGGLDEDDVTWLELNPQDNPFTSPNLECVGVACNPSHFKNIYLRHLSKTSVKVLHVRQSALDLRYFESWAVCDSQQQTENSSSTSNARDDSPVTEAEEAIRGSKLQKHFRQFADQVFGPEGINSLEIVVFGDFGHGQQTYGYTTARRLYLVRSTEGTSKFRLLDEDDPQAVRVRIEYGDMLSACPVLISKDDFDSSAEDDTSDIDDEGDEQILDDEESTSDDSFHEGSSPPEPE